MPRSLGEALLKAVSAAAVTFVVGLALLKAGAALAPLVPRAPTRPTIEPAVGYTVEVRIGDGAPFALRVGDQGEGCDTLEHSPLLARVCNLAITVDPVYIAGDAFGRINVAYGAPFEAVVWRGRLSRGVGACAEAGLEGALLTRCQSSVRRTTYTVSDGGVTVTVPLGVTASG